MAALEAAALFDDAALGERLAIEEDVRRQKAVFVKDLDDAVYSSLKNDAVRMGAYLRAIARAAPGKRVLDVGTGPEALLAVAAAKAGAAPSSRRGEPGGATAPSTPRAWRTSSRSSRATRPRSRRVVSVLGPADVVVSEIVGDLASEEGMAATLAQLPATLVAKTGAWSVPARAETWVAPANLRLPASGDGGSSDVRLPMVPPPATLLGDRRLLECIDANDLRLEQTREHAWTVAAPSTLTGFFCAPKIVLDGEDAIDCWTEATSWRSVLCLLDEPVLVEAGDEVGLSATADLRRFPVVRAAATVNGKPAGPWWRPRRRFSVADSDGDGVLGKEDVASFLKVDEALAVKVMATFDVDEAGALTIDALLPRTNSGDKGTLETVSGALFAVTLKGALRDSAALFNAVPFGYFGAFFVLSGAAADPSKPELVRVASRAAVLADIALQGPKLLFAVALFAANAYGAAQGVDAMALQLDPNANAALSALAALDLTAFNDGVAAVAGAATLDALVSNALGVKADKIPLLSQSAQDYVDRRTPDFDIDNDGDGPQPSF
ncbi:protein-arginine omega-N asymmetric methyltransferase [Aureococcus anophagefferens]|nr:protein-arginine omega-N asymmetric methyltransferase [Aureococcus anophagefferens]